MYTCIVCEHIIISETWVCNNCNWQAENTNGYLTFAPELSLQNSHFNSNDFEFLAAAEHKHFWFRARNNLICWALSKFFKNAQTFLEIGCGTGYVLSNIQNRFPNLSVTGSDIYVTSLPFAKKRIKSNTELFQMDARQMPFRNQFDVIGAFDVLEHIEEDEVVINQMFNALTDRGGVILTVPQHPSLWSASDRASCHVRRYKVNELQKKLENAGFKIKMTSSFVFLLLPLMIASRIIHNNKYDPKNELIIGKRINYMLEKILNLEIKLIKLGLSLPIGGSRFIIATKQ